VLHIVLGGVDGGGELTLQTARDDGHLVHRCKRDHHARTEMLGQQLAAHRYR
jgi:hypothetical protein